MRAVAVLPYVLRGVAARCLATVKINDVLCVDNTGRNGHRNLGVMRSHNLGVDWMHQHDADWLIVMSAAIRCDEHEGGLDFIRALDRSAGQAIVCADNVYGWHLIAFARTTIDACGRWDEQFTPYGFDDNDYAIRIHKALPAATWGKVLVKVNDRKVGMGHSVKRGGVYIDATPQLAYFARKWGDVPGPPFDAYHDHPFGQADNPVGYWPTGGPAGDGLWDRPAPDDDWGQTWVHNPT